MADQIEMQDQNSQRSDDVSSVSSRVSVDEVVNRVYDELKSKLGNLDDVTVEDVMHLIYMTMETVARIEKFTGSQKKAAVQKIAKRLASELPDGQVKSVMMVVVDSALPAVIDGIVDFVKGKFDLNRDGQVTTEEVKQKCGSMFSCFKCCRK